MVEPLDGTLKENVTYCPCEPQQQTYGGSCAPVKRASVGRFLAAALAARVWVTGDAVTVAVGALVTGVLEPAALFAVTVTVIVAPTSAALSVYVLPTLETAVHDVVHRFHT